MTLSLTSNRSFKLCSCTGTAHNYATDRSNREGRWNDKQRGERERFCL